MADITKTRICNMALGHLGVGKELSDVDTDATSESAACLMYYEHALKSMLRGWRWPFAAKHAVLFWQEDDPTTEWDYSYMYPADCLHIRRILSDYRNDANDTRTPYRVVRSDVPDDVDGIVTAASIGGAGNITMNGAYVESSLYTATQSRLITITSDGNESGRTFTVTGTDRDGAALVEAITGPNATTVTSSGYFMTIATVHIDGASAGSVSVGVSTMLGKVIYTDLAPVTADGIDTGPVIEYTQNITDESEFDYDFSLALSYKIAALIAPRITGGDSFNLAQRSIELNRMAYSIAAQAAAAEDQPDPHNDADIIRVRS